MFEIFRFIFPAKFALRLACGHSASALGSCLPGFAGLVGAAAVPARGFSSWGLGACARARSRSPPGVLAHAPEPGVEPGVTGRDHGCARLWFLLLGSWRFVRQSPESRACSSAARKPLFISSASCDHPICDEAVLSPPVDFLRAQAYSDGVLLQVVLTDEVVEDEEAALSCAAASCCTSTTSARASLSASVSICVFGHASVGLQSPRSEPEVKSESAILDAEVQAEFDPSVDDRLRVGTRPVFNNARPKLLEVVQRRVWGDVGTGNAGDTDNVLTDEILPPFL